MPAPPIAPPVLAGVEPEPAIPEPKGATPGRTEGAAVGEGRGAVSAPGGGCIGIDGAVVVGAPVADAGLTPNPVDSPEMAVDAPPRVAASAIGAISAPAADASPEDA
jgi:hypothetical protein